MTVDELKVVIKAETNQFKKDVASAKEQLKETAKEAKNVGKSTSNLGKEFNQFLGKLSVWKILFDLILKLIQSIVSCIKEGIKNIANMDNTFMKDWEEFKASIAQLKDAIGAAFAPLIKTVIPSLTKIIQMTTQLIQNFGKIFSGISGSAWVKASDDVDKYKESVDKAKKATLGIDELNQLKLTDDSSNSNLEAVDIESYGSGFTDMFTSMADLLQPIFDLLNALIEPLGLILARLSPIITKVNSFLKKILEPISRLLQNIGEEFTPSIITALDLIEQVLTPIFDLVNELISAILDNIPPELFTTISDVISEILTIVGLILEPVLDIIDILSPVISGLLGSVIKQLSSSLDLVFKMLQPILDIIEIILTVFNGIYDTVKAIMNNDFASIGDIWSGVGEKIRGIWDNLMGHLKDVWKSAWNWMKDTFKNTLNGIISLANICIDGLNAMLIPVRAIIVGIADAFGGRLSLSDVAIPHIPKLAKGGVIDSPTIAMLGEYSNASSNPEIAAPESTLRAIMTEGNEDLIATFIQVGRQLMTTIEDKDLSVSIGDEVIAKSAARGNRSYFNRTGSNLITI